MAIFKKNMTKNFLRICTFILCLCLLSGCNDGYKGLKTPLEDAEPQCETVSDGLLAAKQGKWIYYINGDNFTRHEGERFSEYAGALLRMKEDGTEKSIVLDKDDKRAAEISLIENIQREDLNPIEKARGIKFLMDEYNLTQQKVADKLGKSRSSIANTVRILNLDERVINLALEGKLSEGHCKSLMAIDDNERQFQMANYIIESGDSVREAEKKMKVRKKVSKKQDNKYIPIYRDIEDTFQGFFGTKVKLDAGEKKGKIIIQYTSNDDLERILGLLK